MSTLPHKPIFCHIRDEKNLGDMLCGARELFPADVAGPAVDFRAVPDGPEPLIVGGGGLLHPGIDDWIARQATKRAVALFGVGLNYHSKQLPAGWHEKIRPCVAVGLRDREIAGCPNRVNYCPCPTAGMLPWAKMAAEAPRDRDMLVFSHYDRPIRLPAGFAAHRMVNTWHKNVTLSQIATSLGRFRRVVTNTYHGALWAVRMGCRVVVWQPFSTRFSTGFPFKVPTCWDMPTMDRAFAWWDTPGMLELVQEALARDKTALADFKSIVETLIS